MLIQEKALSNLPVGSIRSSGRIGKITGLIINPHNLHIDALVCRIMGQPHDQLILPADIRDLTIHGIVIDDHERLIEVGDAVRLKPIIKLEFSMENLKAYVGRRRVGAVEGFAVDNESLFIQKIYVQPTLLSRWSVAQLTFDRRQVHEVTRQKIIFIDSSKVKATAPVKVAAEKPIPQPSLSTSFTDE